MAYTVQELSDMEDIRTLKYRYFRGIDTADMAVLEGLFTDDITVNYRGGTYRVAFSGKAQMMEFLASSFHSGGLAMHMGHMPEITLTGADSAEGVWSLQDVFINLELGTNHFGTAIYRDVYRRENGCWKIAKTEYDRVMEALVPIDPGLKVTAHLLAQKGLQPEQRADISHLIEWDTVE